MAKKVDADFLQDSKNENRTESKKFGSKGNGQTPPPAPIETQTPPPVPGSENKIPENLNEPVIPANENLNSDLPPLQPESDPFKEKFDEYFKGMDGMIGGQIAVGLVDDLKASFLLMYAKKQGIEIDKTALMMDEKTKNFAAFLVDHAIKNNFFDIIKKYPILAALGVIVISGGSTFLMLQMLKGMKSENSKQETEISELKKELESLKKVVSEPVIKNNQPSASDIIEVENHADIIQVEKPEKDPALQKLLTGI